jgi:Cu/Ag efflux pump CusA
MLTSRFYSGTESESAGANAGLILRGAEERVAPMLASALATAFALLPALFLGDIPGLEVIRPMAVVVLGGVVSTMVLDLYILPALMLRYGASREPELELAPAPAAAD